MSADTTDIFTITLDDDPLVHPIIQASLGIPNVAFTNVEAFLKGAPKLKPRGVFTDIHLDQNSSGLDLLPTIRSWWPYCPIFVITSDAADEYIGKALVSGANDFIRKPINAKEISARFRARAVEMSDRAEREWLTFADIILDLRTGRLLGQQNQRHMSHTDAMLLKHLLQNQGTVVTRDEIKRFVWGDGKVTDNALDKKIYEVRQALKDVSDQVRIESAYGKGMTIKVKRPETSAA